MSQKLQNAKNLYLKGIKEGKVEVVKEYTGARYTQHSTGVKDGTAGFIEFFEGFIKRTTSRDIRVIRIIEDGSFVFAHVYQDIDKGSAKWVTTDLFDTDENDKIVEHWDVISEYKELKDTVSGNDMILGDFKPKDLDKTQQNKALVRTFLVDIFQNKNYSNLDKYISSSKYIQHNANIKNGIEAVREFLETQNITYDFVFNVIGEGDYAVSYSKVTFNKVQFATFDIFRIENEKIVEHWDNMEVMPKIEELTNSGKF